MKIRNLVFKQIDYDSTRYWEAVKLRSKVLREPLNMQFTDEQLQAEYPYIHLAAIWKNMIIGCLYLIREGNNARLKQFCVEPELQGLGIGKKIVELTEKFCKENDMNYIYMHAREYAVPFYEKLGYRKYDEQFLEIGLPHWKLQKWLIDNE